MGKRAELKAASRGKILDAAARRLRNEGLGSTGIGPVMKDAGLTHGTFYAHFDSKEALAEAAFEHAIDTNQPPWLAHRDEPWPERFRHLAETYLSARHRDDRGGGCAIAALASEVNQAPEAFRERYGNTVEETFRKIAEDDPAQLDDAIVLMAMCTGGINLARNVNDAELSDRILDRCLDALCSLNGSHKTR